MPVSARGYWSVFGVTVTMATPFTYQVVCALLLYIAAHSHAVKAVAVGRKASSAVRWDCAGIVLVVAHLRTCRGALRSCSAVHRCADSAGMH
jgi:hypothetical protein